MWLSECKITLAFCLSTTQVSCSVYLNTACRVLQRVSLSVQKASPATITQADVYNNY